ncbi:MAG: tRNA (guanosine(37)-N1)-methyltransferase TrmD [Pusillimonas sp.]|nr:tRNA (guanosine(37)-N1)-methyltransferase TrmD [Pusillimonas sp.]
MRFDVITLFPEMFSVVRDLGVTGRAHRREQWALQIWNLRDFTQDVHRTVDDRPYGGGPGMVMLAEPLEKAVTAVRNARTDTPPVILLSPAGKPFTQSRAQALADSQGAVLICGRYEGIDQRFVNRCITEEISLGDFVLSGGEIPALAIMDSVVRLLPGALNDADSARQDSFHDHLTGLLDSPHYTRPELYEGEPVPVELLSGHHANIAQWRRRQSLKITAQRHPDLIETTRRNGLLSKADEAFLKTL